jgi:hypothetical protein
MKLTVEDNRDAIKRYSHIRPSRRGSPRCSTLCPGTRRSCTLERGHNGLHVAHGRFRKVVAVWDGPARAVGAVEPERKAKGAGGAIVRRDLRDVGLAATLRAFWGRLVRRPQFSMEEFLLLVFALAMAGFVIDWALRIIGLR